MCLPGKSADVLGVVEERDGVVIGAEQADFPVEIEEALERRSAPERVVPRLEDEQILGVVSPRHEANDVVIHA